MKTRSHLPALGLALLFAMPASADSISTGNMDGIAIIVTGSNNSSISTSDGVTMIRVDAHRIQLTESTLDIDGQMLDLESVSNLRINADDGGLAILADGRDILTEVQAAEIEMPPPLPSQSNTPPPLPSAKYWYAKDGAPYGPVTLEALRNSMVSGDVTNETLIWRSGMKVWQPAATVLAPPPPP